MSAASEDGAGRGGALARRLSLFDVLAIGVNATVGSGVFSLPDDMHAAMGGWSPLAYVLCSLLLLPVALCFAELSGRFIQTGGAYVYARQAFGDRVGFVVGWYCWANTLIAWAANTTLFFHLLGVAPWPFGKPLGVLSIGLLGVVNWYGVKPGSFLVNLVTVGKLVAIGCFVAVAVFAIDPRRFGGALPHGAAGVGQGVYLALFPLQGFEVTPVTAGETTNPRRNVPLATGGAILLSALLFVVVQAALVGSYPKLAEPSDIPLVEAARYLSPTLGVIVLVGGLVSVGGFNAGSALGAPRYAQAIAENGLLPAVLARIHRRWATPHVAIFVTTSLTAIVALCADYRSLVGMSNLTVCVQYLAACVALPVVRRRFPGAPHGFVVPLGTAVAVLGAAGSIALLVATTLDAFGRGAFGEFYFAGATLTLGVALSWFSRRTSARPA